ncbi:MAG TPA: transketolase C-terminal domain-containing protein [Planctomycetota bacterium]|nr:transketolase C-terminal domain-containing protein [Planctomycetota bacterium]
MVRELTYAQAVREATDQAMELDASVVLVGQGTRDSNAIFGTCDGLFAKYGAERVIEMPLSENALTGVCIGAALAGLRPLYVLQRADFLLLALDQLLNHAAKWRFMLGGRARVPLVIRCIVGKGWGQGPQHSQSLHSVLAHFPGLRVVMPACPEDAKGLLLNAIFGDDTTVIFEGRPSHSVTGAVPEEPFATPVGRARLVRAGSDVTIAAVSWLVPVAETAAARLADEGIGAEVLDLVSISPIDEVTLDASVAKTRRLVVADPSWGPCGFASELSAGVGERLFGRLAAPIGRITLPFNPTPTAAALEASHYPSVEQIVAKARELLRFGSGGPR